MRRRPRLARLLDRLVAWLFDALLFWLLAPNLEWWSTVTQETLDAGFEAWER